MDANLDQSLEYIERQRLMDLRPTILPRQLALGDKISKPMTHLFATFEYVYIFSD